MESQRKSSSQCSDIFPKSFWLFPCLSMLLTIALFLRMEAINNKTEINEMRIYKVELSQMKIMTTLHATGDEDVKLSQGRHASGFRFSVPLSSEYKTNHQWIFRDIAWTKQKWVPYSLIILLGRGTWPTHHDHFASYQALLLNNISQYF